MFITYAPGYTSESHPDGLQTFEELLDAFERGYEFWILEPAMRLAQDPNNGFAVLTLVNAYPDMVAQLRKGKQYYPVDARYKDGLEQVFPEVVALQEHVDSNIADVLYQAMRCGIAHMSFIGSEVGLSEDTDSAIARCEGNEGPAVVVNPKLWLERVILHFRQYTSQLADADNDNLRKAFASRMAQGFGRNPRNRED